MRPDTSWSDGFPGACTDWMDQFCWCCGLVRGSAKVALTYLAHRPAVGLFGIVTNPQRY